jgi:hypothetical protein
MSQVNVSFCFVLFCFVLFVRLFAFFVLFLFCFAFEIKQNQIRQRNVSPVNTSPPPAEAEQGKQPDSRRDTPVSVPTSQTLTLPADSRRDTPVSVSTSQTLALPGDSSARARSPSLPVLPQSSSPTPLPQPTTAPEVPALPRTSLTVPAPSSRSTTPPTVTPFAPMLGVHASTTTQPTTSVDVSTAEQDVVPQIQVSTVGHRSIVADQGKQIGKGHVSQDLGGADGGQLPNFDYRVTDSELAAGDTIESNIEHNHLDASTKVIRSKSTVELRSTVGNINVGASLNTLTVSPVPSPRPSTPTATDNAAPTAPVYSASTNAFSSSNEPNSEASTTIRRVRSAGYNRLSGRYLESVAMHIPSPRICGVAISPTGKLIYFQTLHCKNPILPSASSPQPATSSPGNPPAITSSTNSEPSNTATSTEPTQSTTTNTTSGNTNQTSPAAAHSPRKAARSRAELPTDTTRKTPDRADSPSSYITSDGGYVTEEATEIKAEITDTAQDAKESKSQDDSVKLKDKLKYKLKDILKDKLKYKIGKPKTKSNKPSSKETSESFIGEFNLATFKIRHPVGDDDQTRLDTSSTRRGQLERDSALEESAIEGNRSNEDLYSEGTGGCSEDDYTSDGSSGESTEDNIEDGAYAEGDEVAEPDNLRDNKANAVNNTINSILNKDTKPGNNLTLPFFGVFPRTYPELTTVINGNKVANQFTTSDTVVLAQLKSLNSVSFFSSFF